MWLQDTYWPAEEQERTGVRKKEGETKIQVVQAEDEREQRDEGVEVVKEREAKSPAGE